VSHRWVPLVSGYPSTQCNENAISSEYGRTFQDSVFVFVWWGSLEGGHFFRGFFPYFRPLTHSFIQRHQFGTVNTSHQSTRLSDPIGHPQLQLEMLACRPCARDSIRRPTSFRRREWVSLSMTVHVSTLRPCCCSCSCSHFNKSYTLLRSLSLTINSSRFCPPHPPSTRRREGYSEWVLSEFNYVCANKLRKMSRLLSTDETSSWLVQQPPLRDNPRPQTCGQWCK
jgi:hypothetical protein